MTRSRIELRLTFLTYLIYIRHSFRMAKLLGDEGTSATRIRTKVQVVGHEPRIRAFRRS